MTTFREFVRKSRLERGMSQKALAREVGVNSQTVISLFEAGKKHLPVEVSQKIIELFGETLPEGIEPPIAHNPGSISTHQKAHKNARCISSIQTEYPIAPIDWLSDQGVLLPSLKDRFELDWVEPMIRNGCFKLRHSEALLAIGVEFTEGIFAVDIKNHFEQRSLRHATFLELLTFGALYPQIRETKFVLQYGSLFWDGGEHQAEIRGAGFFPNLKGKGRSLCFQSLRNTLLVKFCPREQQLVRIPSGTIVLGIPKSSKESVFPNNDYDNNWNSMVRNGLDEEFNDGLYVRAVELARSAGKEPLLDIPSTKSLLVNAYFNDQEVSLFKSLGYFPTPATSG